MGGGVFGLGGVEDGRERTLRFGSWSSVYIKFGSPSVWDYFITNFRLKVTCKYVCKRHGYTL